MVAYELIPPPKLLETWGAAALPSERTMAYLSKAQRAQQNARQKWMTLKEALAHIRRVEKMDEKTAVREIKLALTEGAVVSSRPISDEILQRIGDSPTKGIPLTTFIPPEDYWACVWIDPQLGTIEELGENTDPPQEVWVLKESIVNIWKDPEPARSTEPEKSAIEPPTSLNQKVPLKYTGKAINRKLKATKDQIRPALRKFLTDHPNPPDVHVMRVLIQDQLGIGVPRKDFEAILFYDPEFEDYRREPGRPLEK
jgi:hypothetical protein